MRERWAQFTGQPTWRREAQGWFSLKAPYGVLVVRRENNAGWVAERNGTPLRYLSLDPAYSIRRSYSTIILTRRRARSCGAFTRKKTG